MTAPTPPDAVLDEKVRQYARDNLGCHREDLLRYLVREGASLALAERVVDFVAADFPRTIHAMSDAEAADWREYMKLLCGSPPRAGEEKK